ncbi:hypothetical protein [Nostoc sp.]|uniref:hypothetical protein n=1 Tax=Nostoc sp. TaxID=1180 RepID=UPI002FF6B240
MKSNFILEPTRDLSARGQGTGGRGQEGRFLLVVKKAVVVKMTTDTAAALADIAPALVDIAPALADMAAALADIIAPALADMAAALADIAPVLADMAPVLVDMAPALVDMAPVIADQKEKGTSPEINDVVGKLTTPSEIHILQVATSF